MLESPESYQFPTLNNAYNEVFKPNKLSIGLVVPIETYTDGPVPSMVQQLERIQLAERLGFAAVWLRDVPFNIPSFGDVGQIFDPLVYLGFLAGQTSRIALGVASIILPLRHPAHVAKAAMSADVLSGGRLLLGVASGDRPEEYPAMGFSHAERGKRFLESYAYIREMEESWPRFENSFGKVQQNADMLPKPVAGQLPILITGGSQQEPAWIAENGDGWMVYPRPPMVQRKIIGEWRTRTINARMSPKPAMQPLYIDLLETPPPAPVPIHLGWQLGAEQLIDMLTAIEDIGINHVALNLRFNTADIEKTLEQLARTILPRFNPQSQARSS